MSIDAFSIVRAGIGASIQDRGRPGLARFGVPPGGVMDDHAAGWANRLVDNPIDAPVLELLLQGARLDVLGDTWIAIAGADAQCNVPLWRRTFVRAGDSIVFPASRDGLWTYVAVEGGFDAPRYFGSASVYPRGRIGRMLASGDMLRRSEATAVSSAHAVAGRALTASGRRTYGQLPALRVWPGPQWDLFTDDDRIALFGQAWTMSSASDRVGYRLDGPRLTPPPQIPSEPVLVGSIQVPPLGQPIVTMRDGPTVGGYPKIGLVDPEDVSWLAQCRPGTPVTFVLAQEAGSSDPASRSGDNSAGEGGRA